MSAEGLLPIEVFKTSGRVANIVDPVLTVSDLYLYCLLKGLSAFGVNIVFAFLHLILLSTTQTKTF